MGFLVLIIFFNGILGVKKNGSDYEEDIGKYSKFWDHLICVYIWDTFVSEIPSNWYFNEATYIHNIETSKIKLRFYCIYGKLEEKSSLINIIE